MVQQIRIFLLGTTNGPDPGTSGALEPNGEVSLSVEAPGAYCSPEAGISETTSSSLTGTSDGDSGDSGTGSSPSGPATPDP